MYESFSSNKPSIQWLGEKPQTLEGPGDSSSSFPWGLVGTVAVIGLILYFVSGSATISAGRDNPYEIPGKTPRQVRDFEDGYAHGFREGRHGESSVDGKFPSDEFAAGVAAGLRDGRSGRFSTNWKNGLHIARREYFETLG